MTAYPHSFTFVSAHENSTPVLVRPKVVERYWGYEVAENDEKIDLLVIARFAAVLSVIAAFTAAIGIWVAPAAAATGIAPMVKMVTSLFLLAVVGTLFQFASCSTRVRAQIDTANGELREVVAGLFGSDVVLAHYGFDAVHAVAVVASRLDPNVGQLQIAMKSGEIVPAGDGTLIALRHLRDRVASDCGLEGANRLQSLPCLG